jgi:threonine synthase
MQHYGADVIRGGRREQMLTRLVHMGGWFPASVYCPRGGCANPFGVEGFKTIAFEVFEQLGNRVPDAVFVPTGSGDGLYGVFKGFLELRELGVVDRLPRMLLCQAAAVAPYLEAFRAKRDRVSRVTPQPTAALSIAEPIGGDHALRAVYESNGDVMTATEQEIAAAIRAAALSGYAIEPASATALACALSLGAEVDNVSIVIATGAAVKWPEHIIQRAPQLEVLPESFDRVEELVSGCK